MQYRKYPHRFIRHLFSAPFIYAPFFVMIPMDLVMEIYHRVCFPLYGLPYVPRGNYIKIDRQKLAYLSWIQKVNCMYCGYANGLFPYIAAVCAETEKYWCGIQHQKDPNFVPPMHHQDFIPYGDEKSYDEVFGDTQRNARK